IRDLTVTGVQTCALPILPHLSVKGASLRVPRSLRVGEERLAHVPEADLFPIRERIDGRVLSPAIATPVAEQAAQRAEIGMQVLRSEEHTSELQSQSNLVC